MASYTQKEIFEQVRAAMVDLFEMDESAITPQAHLFQELGLDSIDAVDLVVTLKNKTGIKVRPEDFKTVRTVNDVVAAVMGLLQEDNV